MPLSRRHVLLLLPLGLMGCFGPLFDDYDRERDWDQDGVEAGADCDDEDSQVTQLTFWSDNDRDGYGADGAVVYGCAPPDGYADNDDDCDDNDANAYREAAWYEDLDIDGFGVGEPEIRCAGYGTSEIDGDCDDARSDVYPGATPVCGNGVDDDCDGLGECGGLSESEESAPPDGTYSGTEGSELGASVAGVGDVNGDGYADILLGAPGVTDADGEWVGAAVLMYGPAPAGYAYGASVAGVVSLVGTVSEGRAGETVSGAGDLDGDGYDDLLIGAPMAGSSAGGGGWGGFGGGMPMAFGPGDGGGIPGDIGDGIFDDEGAGYVYVVLGPVMDQEVRLGENIRTGVLKGSEGGGQAGAALASLGDVTGDGFDDFLVGAPLAANDEDDESGMVWLVPGPFTEDDTLDGAALWTLTGSEEGDRFGTSAAAIGDLDGDGQDDFAVGAPTDALNGLDSAPESDLGLGKVFFYLDLRSTSDPADITDLVMVGSWGAGFGTDVAGVGDVNGDGTPEVAVGAPGFTGAGEASGAIFVYSGADIIEVGEAGGDPIDAQIAQIDGALALESLGTAICGPGDLDGDDMHDLFVGAPEADEGHGAVAVYYGPLSATASLEDADFLLTGAYTGTRLGHAVAGVGDANGLGRSDLIFSALELDGDAYGSGQAYFLASDGF